MIRLKIETKGSEGPVEKRVRIYSNDPRLQDPFLVVKADVRAPIRLSSRFVQLTGAAGETESKTVEVTSQLDRPLNLEPVQFNLEQKVVYRIEEQEKGRRYLIVFSSVPGPAQTYQGLLRLRTGYPEIPELTIRIRGRFGLPTGS